MKSEIFLYHFASTRNFVKTGLPINISFEIPLKIGYVFFRMNSNFFSFYWSILTIRIIHFSNNFNEDIIHIFIMHLKKVGFKFQFSFDKCINLPPLSIYFIINYPFVLFQFLSINSIFISKSLINLNLLK